MKGQKKDSRMLLVVDKQCRRRSQWVEIGRQSSCTSDKGQIRLDREDLSPAPGWQMRRKRTGDV